MSGVIVGTCKPVIAFTGLGACAMFEQQPKGLILTTTNFKVPKANVANIGTYIQQQAKLPSDAKVFPLLDGLVNVEPSGGDVRISQEGFGESKVNGHNPYQEIFTFTKGGLCMLKQLLKLHGSDMRVFFVDDNYVTYGVETEDGDVQGFNVNIGVSYRKNVGTAVSAIILTLLYSNHYYNEFSALTSFSLPTNTQGTKHVAFVGASTSGTEALVKLQLLCSGLNVTPLIVGLMESVQISALMELRDANGVLTPTNWGYASSTGDNADMIEMACDRTIVPPLRIKTLSSYTAFMLIVQANGLGIDSEYH